MGGCIVDINIVSSLSLGNKEQQFVKRVCNIFYTFPLQVPVEGTFVGKLLVITSFLKTRSFFTLVLAELGFIFESPILLTFGIALALAKIIPQHFRMQCFSSVEWRLFYWAWHIN